MKRHILFLHQSYAGQFGPIIRFISRHYDVDISFISHYKLEEDIDQVRHYFYELEHNQWNEQAAFLARDFEKDCRHMGAVYYSFRVNGLHDPDLIVGHTSWGNLGAFHVPFHHVPRIGYFEFFYDITNPDILGRQPWGGFEENLIGLPMRNATPLLDLEYCTKGYCPTHFQKSMFPARYHDKLAVFFDGIDCEFFYPIPPEHCTLLERTWPADAPIITFASPGLESIRGFDIFMDVAQMVLERHPTVHFVIAGEPKSYYGMEEAHLQGRSFKDHILEQGNYDLSRFHFLGHLPLPALRELFSITSCHFFWTVHYTVSWSLFQAMACGALVMASDTGPPNELVSDGINGLLRPPYDKAAMSETLLSILGNPKPYQPLSKQARETILECYSTTVCLPPLAQYLLES